MNPPLSRIFSRVGFWKRNRQLYVRRILAVGVCLLVIALGSALLLRGRRGGAAAQGVAETLRLSTGAQQQIKALLDEKARRSPAQRKLDSQLLYAVKMRRGEDLAPGIRQLSVKVDADADAKTIVDITASVGGSLIEDIEAAGAEILSVYPQYNSIRARVPLDRLEQLAAFSQVRFIQPKQEAQYLRHVERRRAAGETTGEELPPGFPARASRVRGYLDEAMTGGLLTGGKNSEGDTTHRAAAVRTTFGANGAGVRIGVLSDGVASLAVSQASGDLPANVVVLPGQTGAGDEGTAMLEIIHDLAPGAQLYFATANGGIAGFAQAIRDLRAAGCDIIVDDLLYYGETPLQDGQAPGIVSTTNGGVIWQAVNEVVASGALYFSAAGNSGNKNDGTSGTWQGDFVDGGAMTLLPGGTVHNFGNGTLSDLITAAGSVGALFWADPLGASSNDYDLFVLNSAGTSIVASSTNLQNGTQDPIELVGGISSGNRLVILKKSGAANRFLSLMTYGGRLSINTEGAAVGHACAAGAFSVAATPAANAFGASPNPTGPFPSAFGSANIVELFSSDGPRRIFFNANGTAITPGNFLATGGTLRQKPDLTAADGVTVSGAGGFVTRFFGTSAAAPHAAAIAALLRSANPTLSASQVRTALTASAIDIETAGLDRDSGAGIVMAFQALQSVGATASANLQTGTITLADPTGNGNTFVEPGESASLTVQLLNTGPVSASGVSAVLTTSTPGVTITAGSSAYANLSATSGTATNTTPFAFSLASSASCPLRLDFTLTVTYSGAGSPKVLPFTLRAGAPPLTITSTLDATTPVTGPGYTAATGFQNQRLFRDGLPSICGEAKTCPGTFGTGTRRYDAYTFTNCSTNPSCVTVTLSTPCVGNTGLSAAAYLGGYDPNNLCMSYLADAGFTPGAAPANFSFTVPAGATFTVVVNEVNSDAGIGCGYTINLDGLCCQSAGCPTVSQLSPTSGIPGGNVMVAGTNLGGVTGVKFANNIPASFSVVNNSTLNVVIPSGVANGPLTLSRPNCPDVKTPAFTFPASLNPNGELFVDDGTMETAFNVSSSGMSYYVNRLTPTAYPATLTKVVIFFQNFSFSPTSGTQIDILSGVNPSSGTTIDNTVFTFTPTSVQGGNSFNVYNVPPITITSGDFIVGFRIPYVSGIFPAAIDTTPTVKNRSYYSSNGTAFTLYGTANLGIRAGILQNFPNVTAVNPGSGTAGTQVTLTGTNLNGVTAVKFSNNVTSQFTVNSSTQITATVPSAAVTGPLTLSKVGTPDVTAPVFVVGSCPSVSGISPAGGLPGTNVTISGAGFTGVSSVKFSNNVTAQFTVNSNTQITATVPSGTVSGPITISKPSCPDVQTPSFTLGTACPTVASISPASGPLGGTVTITGASFTGVSAVKFGGNTAAQFTINNDNSITATVPSNAVTGTVTLTKPGCTDVLGGTFTVTPGIIAFAGSTVTAESCSPANNAIDPGETVTINLSLRNVGTSSTTNLVATLQSAGGITLPSAPQTYGALAAGGAAVSKSFTFTASGNCGGALTATLSLQDGSVNRGIINIALPLGVPKIILSESFDTVTVPSLPTGWISTVAAGTAPAWVTSALSSDTLPNNVFATDPGFVSDVWLDSPNIAITSPVAQLTFRHSYDLEAVAGSTTTYDGGALEIAIGSGAFTDILAAGGSFVTGGYNRTISVTTNPLFSRQVWSSTSGGYITTTVNLPASAAGQTIKLRWRMASDDIIGAPGWRVDTIRIADGAICSNCGPVCPTISLTPTSLPGGVQGSTYSQTLTASGGTSPYTFAVTAGALPSGLTLSSGGTLSGTPTVSGTFNFTVTATAANACTGSQSYSITIQAPILCPVITGINPGSGLAGSSVAITGANLTGVIAVQFSGNVAASFTINSDSQITTTVPNGALTGPITLSKAGCINTQTGTFTVLQPNPVPVLSSLSPNSALAGGQGFTLTVSGANFVPGSAVRWNGNSRTTTFVSATQLMAQIPASDIAVAGTPQVTVFNPTPGGGQSGALNFTIIAPNPTPQLTSLSPFSVFAGSSGFTLAVNGSSFVAGAVVRWNGADRQTAFVSGAQLTALISAADVATAGTATVTVFNPAPGGGLSNSLSFTINQNCSYLLNPTSQSFTASGGTGSVAVTANSGCVWTASSNAGWITITSGGSGNGNGTVNYSVAANTGAAREGTMIIAGQAFTVTQGCADTVISAQPASLAVCTGAAASFSVTATGAGTLGFQWRKNGVNIAGATGSSYNIPVATANDAGTYTVVVTGACDSRTSNAATLTVNTPPSVTAQPGNQTVTLGATATFTAAASGSPAPSVQWQVSTDGFNFINIPGATSATLTLNNVTLGQNGNRYRAVFTNLCNSATSNAATLTVNCPTIAIAPDALPNGSTGAAYSQTLTASGGVAAYRFSISAGVLPAGLNLSTAGILSGTPVQGGTFNFTVTATDANNCSGSRAYTLIIGCVFDIAPRSQSFTASGGADSVSVTTGNSCGWAAISNAAWITINGAASGSGNGTVNYSVASNSDTSQRTGTMTIAGLTFTVTQSGVAPNPTPIVSGVNPASVAAGGNAFTLIVNGSNFVNGAAVRLNGSDRLTSFVSAAQLTAQISAADIAAAGSVQIAVFNPAPGGGISNTTSLVIVAQNPVPVVSGLNPTTVIAGGGAFTLTVNGASFASGATVRWNGSNRQTNFVSSTQLTAQILATDIATAGSAQITVFNPSPGGGQSNALGLTIIAPNPVPAITGLSPNTVPMGGGGFLLTINGANFVNGAMVRLNDGDRQTNFISPTQLTAQILATDIATAGTARITVFNPAPGGGSSVAANLTITPPVVGFTISGKITYADQITRGVPGAVVTASVPGAPPLLSQPSGSDGQYAIVGVAVSNYIVSPMRPGGVNGVNGVNGITAFDAARILQRLATGDPFTGIQRKAADVDNDGVVDALDARRIANFVVGKVEDWGLAGKWGFDPEQQLLQVTGNVSLDFRTVLIGDVSLNWRSNASPFIGGVTPITLKLKSEASGNLLDLPGLVINGYGFAPGMTLMATFPDGGEIKLSGPQLIQTSPEVLTVAFSPNIPGLWTFRIVNADGQMSDAFIVKVE